MAEAISDDEKVNSGFRLIGIEYIYIYIFNIDVFIFLC